MRDIGIDSETAQGSSKGSSTSQKKSRKPEISPLSRIHVDKQAKPSKKAVNGRNVGKLSLILDMPLDIIHEIAGKLHPLDLLQLSRVSKQFRITIASKSSSKSLWIASRRSLPGLPECPQELTELQYTSLLFESSCMACGIGRALKVDYALHVRFCSACWKVNIIYGRNLYKNSSPATQAIIPSMLSCVFRLHMQSNGTATGNRRASRNNLNDSFYKPAANEVAQELESLTLDSPEYVAYVLERQEYAQEAHEHSVAVFRWFHKLESERKDNEAGIATERRKTITAKLESLGYSADDFPDDTVTTWCNLILQPRPITARIWNNILPKLEHEIEVERERRRIEAYDRRVVLREDELYRRLEEFILDIADSRLRYWIPFKYVMEIEDLAEMVLGEDAQEELTPERFLPIGAKLKEYGAGFEISIKEKLIQQLKTIHKLEWPNVTNLGDDSKDEILLRATSIFGCSFEDPRNEARNFYGSYEDVLEHIYTTRKRGVSWDKCHPCVWENGTVMAHKIARHTPLPLPATYEEVSGKYVCTCLKPSFWQPGSFTDLVKHFHFETEQYATMAANLSPNRDSSLTLDNYHDLTKYFGLICEADGLDSLEFEHGDWLPSVLSPGMAVMGGGYSCCAICQNLMDPKFQREHGRRKVWFRISSSDIGKRDFVHHVRSYHKKQPTQDDVLHVYPH